MINYAGLSAGTLLVSMETAKVNQLQQERQLSGSPLGLVCVLET